jgi:hypothetical protein
VHGQAGDAEPIAGNTRSDSVGGDAENSGDGDRGGRYGRGGFGGTQALIEGGESCLDFVLASCSQPDLPRCC